MSIVPFGAQAADDLNFTNTADVSVVVNDSPDPVYQGQNITYDIVVKNNSPDTAANGVVVTDTVCPNAYFVSATGAPYTAYVNDIIFQVGTLSPGQSLVIKMVTKVSGTAATENIPSTSPDIGTTGPKPEIFDIWNSAVLNATTSDSNITNNSYYQMTNVLPAVNSNPSYKIDKTVIDVAGQGPLGNVTTVGDVITYQIKVSNNGDVNLTNITVTDSLIDLTGPAESVNTDGVLQVGEKWEYIGRYTATQQDISTNGGGNQLIENTATVDCDQLAPKSDIAEVPFRGLKAFIVDKTVLDVAGQGPSGNISAAGEIIQYQIRVANVGNADLMNVKANDSLVSLEKPGESLNTNGVLEIGETWVYTAYYTVTQEDISTNGGGDQIIENTATIVCDELVPKTATTEVPLKGLPAYIIQKNVMDVAGKGPKGTATRAGNIITYEIIVRNVGNIGLTNVSVSDSLLGVLKNYTESMSDDEIMEDEETWTYTGFYNVTSEDIRTNGGGDKLINNIATVSCDQLPAKSDNADAPVGSPSYILDKLVTDVAGRGPAGNVTQVGDVISYLITIRNTGNVNLTTIIINDSLTNLTGPVESKNVDGILNKQENWNYTGNYTVTQDDINTNGGGDKLIENKVTVVCEELDPRSKSDTVEVPLEVPSYIIDKSVLDIAGNGPTGNITKAGDKISYKVSVRNVGTIDLTNLTVIDTLIPLTGPTELLSPNGVLNVGENWTYAGNYTVTQEDLNTNGGGNQLIENTATVDCDQLDPKSDSAEVPIKGAPAYIIEKTVTDVAGKGPSEKLRRAGDRISYQIVINNTGNVDLTNLTLSDPLISLSSPVESQNAGRVLEVGENWVYTGTYNVTQEDINNNGKGKGLINNTATVDCYQLDAMQDSAEVLIERNPACSVDKVVTDVAGKGPAGTITTAGDIASYRISVNNTGNVDLTNVTVSDSLINLTAPLESLYINGILEVGEIWTYNSSYNVTQKDINNNGNANGSLENTVTVSSDQLDPITDKANVPILRAPDYNINKTAIDVAGKGPAAEVTKAGEIVSYFIALNNTGNVELTNVSVVDSLISLTGPVESKTPDRILEVGENWNYTGNYTVTQEDLNNNFGGSKSIKNTAIVDCDQLDAKSDFAEVNLEILPACTIDKRISDVAGTGAHGLIRKAGDVISYQINVNNKGNIDLTNASVADSLINLTAPDESKAANGILEVGENWSYAVTYKVTQADLNNNGNKNGSIENTATVDSDQLEPQNDSATAFLERKLGYSLNKTVIDVGGSGPTGIITEAGEKIAYQVKVENYGNVDLTNITMSDSLTNLSGPIESKNPDGILEVEENWTYTGNYTATQTDLNSNGSGNGKIENTATVDCAQLDPLVSSAEVPLKSSPACTIEKSVINVAGKGPAANVTKAGEKISYSIIVNNTGNVDLTNVSTEDSLINLSVPFESKIANGILEVGEAWNYTGDYTVSQADMNTNAGGDGFINNTATVDSDQLEPQNDSANVPLLRLPDYNINKNVTDIAGKGPAANVTKTGEIINYSIIIGNSGNVDLTNVTVIDSLTNLTGPVESKNPDGILEAEEIWNYNGSYTVTQKDINSNGNGDGFIDNTATVDCDQMDPKTDAAKVPVTSLPGYSIEKTVTDVAGKGPEANVTKAGERISYSINVNNTGNVELTNITIDDSLTNLTEPLESLKKDRILEVGETWICAGNYTVTQENINTNNDGKGFIENIATVDCDQLNPKSDNATVLLKQLPEYFINKTVIDVGGRGSAANITAAGDIINYQINVSNSGNLDLTNVSVIDSLIKLRGPRESKNGDLVLEVGEIWTFSGNYSVSQADINLNGNGNASGFIENIATVDSDQLEPRSSAAKVPVKQMPAYTIDKNITDVEGKGSTSNITKTGEIISYLVSVKNTGNLDLTNVTVNDSLISLADPVESKISDRILEVGETWNYTGNYTVKQTDINNNGNGNGAIENTATVDCAQLDPKSDIAEIFISQTPDYLIDKTITDIAGKGPAANITKAGDPVTYQINVTNSGNLDLTNVNVTDSLINLKGPTESKTSDRILEVGENWLFTGNYSVTQADINSNGNGNGKIENTATVDCDRLDPKTDEENVYITQSPEYMVTKIVMDVAGKGSGANVTKAGERISYSIIVNNTGNTELTNVTTSDSLINLTGPKESKIENKILEVGENWTYSGNYSVTQEDMNSNGDGNGEIENVVKVDCDQLEEKSDTAEVPLKSMPDYNIDKIVTDVSGNGASGNITKAGDIVNYQINVSNTGNLDLTNITVSDSLISLTSPMESLTTNGILEVGERWIYNGSYTATQADINTNGGGNGFIENKATVNCDKLDPKSDEENVSITLDAGYTIEKIITDIAGKGPTANITKAGDALSYQINVTNAGNVDLTNITLTDSLINLAEPLESLNVDGILSVGESWLFNGNYTVKQMNINTNGDGNGKIENTATVDCDQLDSKSDSANASIELLPDYVIDKIVIDVAGKGPAGNITKAGEIISYQINVSNTGNIDLTNLTVNDSLITLKEPLESLNVNKVLEVGENWTYEGNYTVKQTDMNNNGGGDGFINNTATVDCDQLDQKNDSAIVPIKQDPSDPIDKTVIDISGKGPEANVTIAGDIITYRISITNDGNIDLTNVSVIDSLINLTEPLELLNTNKVLEVGETWIYIGNYNVTQNDINNNGGGDGFINNTVTVSSDQLAPTYDSASVPISRILNYTVEKTAVNVAGKGSSGNITKAGETIHYQVKVNNTGNTDLTNVNVNDSLINLTGPIESLNSDLILEVGESWTYNGNYTVIQEDINSNGNGNGLIENLVKVDCDQLEEKSDNAEVPIKSIPAYTIDKAVLDVSGRGPSGNIRKAGDIVDYFVIVNNTGNIDLTNVTVTDSLISLIGPQESVNKNGILEVGETWNYTGNLTVTQKDINKMLEGYVGIYNRATVDCDQLDPKGDGVNVPVLTNPDYTIDKKVLDIAGRGPTANVTKAGEVVSYSVIVNNTGNIDLTNAKIIDSLTELIGPVESKTNDKILEVEETWNYTGNYTATQEDINSNESGEKLIENNATVDCDQLEPKSAKVQTPINVLPAYNINKTVVDVAGKGSSANVTAAGDKIVYLVNITNTGNSDLTNVTVADTLINLSGPIESKTGNRVLEVGETWSYTGNYTVKQADINTNGEGDGFIDNTATVKSDQLKEKSDTAKVPLNGTAGFVIDKIVTDIAGKGPSARVTKAGEKITYQVIVANSGNIDLTNVTVDDSLINLTSPDESLTADKVLEVGENWTYEGNYTVTQADINTNGDRNGFIENTATVDCDQLTPKSDSEKVSLSRKLDYSIDKIVVDVGGKGPIGKATKAGEKITYSIIVTNEGNANLANVTVIDSLTNLGEPFESWTKNKILEVGEFWIFESKYTVTQNDINTNGNGDGFIENTVQVSCDELEPKSKTAKVPVKISPEYSIDKKAVNIAGKGLQGNITKANDIIEYSVIVNNTGNVELTNATVSDSLIALEGPIESKNSDRVLEVGESWNYNGNYRVTQIDINSNGNGSGVIKNTATVDSDQLDPKTDNADVPIAQSAAYTIDKMAVNIAGNGSSANVTKAGEIIEYRINVSNTGNTELANISVYDSLISLTGPVESKTPDRILETEEIWIYTGNYTVTQEDINSNGGGNGLIENIVTVDSDQLEPKTDNETVPVNYKPAYSISKEATSVAGRGKAGNITKEGDIIGYQINVINEGNVELTNITVNDPLVILTRPLESLNADEILEIGETWTYTGNYTTTQNDLDNNGNGKGFIENIATVDCDQLEPETDTETVPIIQNFSYLIEKRVTQIDAKGNKVIDSAGDTIDYEIEVINQGNINLTNVSVTDSLISLTAPRESKTSDLILEIEESWIYTGTYTVTQADIDSNGNGDGLIENLATVSCDQLAPKSNGAKVPIIQDPALNIDKSASPESYSDIGQIITYTYNITNIGNMNVTAPITVTDNKTGTINVPEEILIPGQTVLANKIYIITQADLDAGSVTNSAYVTGNLRNNTTTSNTDNETVTSIQNPGLLIDKSASPSNYSSVGDIITYTYNVTNKGNVNITGPITVIDNRTGTINVTGNLIPAQSILINNTYSITQADIDSGSITNSAFATGKFGNNTTTSNTDNETITSEQKPALLINKSADPAIYSAVGDIITYTYNISNIGNVNITGPLTVIDNKIGTIKAASGNLTPGQNILVNATYNITQTDIDAGFVTNSALATGIFGNNTTTSNTDNETVTSTQSPKLEVEKSGFPTNYSFVGQIITYRYNVTNIGNVIIAGPIEVTDNKTGTIIVTAGNLVPGQSVIKAANYTITQEDLNAGSVTNSAFATGTFGNNTTISNTDNETVTGDYIPALLINKTADPKTYGSAGDLITYTYNVTNTGNVNITGSITVIDDKVGTVSIPDGNLVPGQSISANATYIIIQADLDRGFVTNSAYAAGTSRNKNTISNTDNETVTAVQNASYEIKKIVTDATQKGSSSNVANAGDVIGYQINVTNNGNINLTNVTVEDPLLGNLNGPVESLNSDNVLEAREIWTYTGNYTVTQQDIDSNGNGDGIIDNTATVKSDQLDPESDSVQVPIEGKPGYIIEKTVTNVAGKGPDGAVTKAGESITYRINVTNTGNINLTNISLNDTLITIPDLIESQNSNKVLEVGEIWTYTGNYTVTQEDINSNGNGTGFIENIATVKCDQLEPKKDSTLVSIDQNPMHIIEKTITDVAGKGPLTNVTEAGDIITYQINISNVGNIDFTNVTVTDSLITLEGPAESLNPDNVLQVGENWSYIGNYTVTQEDLNSNGNGTGLIKNTATVDCDQAEPSSDDAQVPIQNKPGYILDKIVTDVAGNGPFANVTKAGDAITYQITVTNAGNVNLTNVTLKDPLIAFLDPIESLNTNRVLEVGENWTYRGNYIVTQADIENNEAEDRFIENTATVDCDQLEPVSDSAQVTVEKQQKKKPGYIIEKTVTDVAGKGSDGKVTKPGDLIVYQINVTNTGNVNLTNITLTDSLITVSGPIESLDINGVLEIGETWTYTGTYTVTQADIDSNGDGNGFINNTATVDCDQLGPNSDSEAVAVERNTDYIIEKSVLDVAGKGPAGNVTSAGEIVSYQIAVRNTGNVDLTNISITDSLITLTGPTGDKEPVGILNVGENWVYTGNYTVTQADIDTNGEGNGFIDNVATVDCDQLDSKSDSESVEIARKIKLPDYLIQKSIIGVDEAGDGIINAPGDTIEYQVIVKNTGEVNLANVSVVDSLITLTGPRESITADMILEIGETWILTGNYTVTQADINSNGGGDGFIDNTATVSCNELPIKSSAARQPILYKPAYNIYKSIVGIDEAGDCIINKPGDIIEYIIAVKNEGNVDLTDISVQDALITSLTGPIGDDIDPGVLNPGETWKYTGIYTVTEEDINSNGDGDRFIENIAIVSSKELPEKSSVAAQPIIQKTDLCVYKCINGADKAGDCVINKPGEIIEYEIVVKNSGRTDLTGVLVNDPMLTLTGPTGDNIMPGILNPGEIWKYTGKYTVTQEDINSNGGGDGFIENTVTVHTNEAPEEKSSARQAIAQKSDYCIYKSVTKIDEAGDCIINKPGDKVEYCVVVKNEGNSDLTGILIKDTLINLIGPAGDDIDPGVLNPGEAWKYSGTYIVTEQDIKTNGNGDGFIENTATVSCNELSPRDSTIKQAIVSPSSETGTDSNPIIIPGNEKDKDSNPDGSTGGNNNNGNGNGGNGGGSSGGSSRKSSGGSSSGTSSGGGAGGSPEPAKNVETKEIAQAFVTNGKAVKFEFINNATCVVYVSFDARKTAGKVTTIVEMLKGKSALVPELPAGETYKSFNVWVGNEGFATAKNIDNAVVCFRVEKAWVEENKINKSTIILNRYNKQWEQLSTSSSGEDDKFLYFVAETSEFGSFAITAEKYQIPDSNVKSNNLNSSESKEIPEEQTINESANGEASNTSSNANKEEKSISGFGLLCGLAGVSAAFLYKRR